MGESKKAGLKLSIQKTKIMASSPITSWQIDRETMETVTDFIFLTAKITADGDCRHEIKTVAPWKESYNKPRLATQRDGMGREVEGGFRIGTTCTPMADSC